MRRLLALFLLAAPCWGAYSFTRLVTVSNSMVSNTTQTGYTLTIPLTVTDFGTTLKVVGSGGHVQNSSGFDIGTFTDATCSTKYPWDLFGYSSTAGTGTLKVKRDVSVSVNTTLTLCYGDATISTFQGGAASTVYPTGTTAMYHLEGGSPTDAMGSFNGSVTATVSSGTGKVGTGAAVTLGSGLSNYINLGSTGMGIFNGTGTLLYVEGWVNTTNVSLAAPGAGLLMGKVGTAASPSLRWFTGNSNQSGKMQLTYAKENALTNAVIISTAASAETSGVLTYIVAVLDLATNANCRIFLNGALNTSGCTTTGTAPTVLAALGGNATLFADGGTLGFAGTADEIQMGNALPTGGVLADWVATRYNNESAPATYITIGSEAGIPAFSIAPSGIPTNHAANITLTLTGSNTTWVNGTTVFTLSGATGVTKISQNVTSNTAATIVVTTGSGTGTLTVTESVTGTAVGAVTVGAGALAISPTSGNTSTTPTLSLTGTNTVWTQETAAGLFSVSGGTGSSIATPTITTDTAGTAVLTVGSTSGNLTVTDNSTSATATFSVPLQVTFPSASVYQSPNAWLNSGGVATCYNGGCYMKFKVTGTTSIIANVDTTVNNTMLSQNDMPTLKIHVDSPTTDGTWAFAQLPFNNTANTPVTLASGLTSGTIYTVTLYGLGGFENDANSWTGTTNQTRLLNLQFSSGATLSAYTPRAKTCIFWGDSYLQGYFGAPTGGAYYLLVDATLGWPFMVAGQSGLNCEYMQVGIGGQGWGHSGGGSSGFPPFPSTWNGYDSTHAKTLTCPDYTIVAQGVNDASVADATVTAAVTAWIPAFRAVCATSKVFILQNIAQLKKAAIQAGVTAAADPLVYVIDPGSEYTNATFNGCSVASWAAPDCLHLNSTYQGILGVAVMRGVIQTISGGGGGSFSIGN